MTHPHGPDQPPKAGHDGRWVAYRVSPMEGDSEVFVRATGDDKVYRFPAGEAPAMGGGPGGPGLEMEDHLKERAVLKKCAAEREKAKEAAKTHEKK